MPVDPFRGRSHVEFRPDSERNQQKETQSQPTTERWDHLEGLEWAGSNVGGLDIRSKKVPEPSFRECHITVFQ